MYKMVDALFVVISIISGLSLWLWDISDPKPVPLPAGVYAAANPPGFNANNGPLLAKLEQLFAESGEASPRHKPDDLLGLTDIGTRLERLIDNAESPTEIEWSYIDSMLDLSFPGRDSKTALGILRCYRAYRSNLQDNYPRSAATAQTHEQLRYNLQVKYFGRQVANTLFATEHRMLAELKIVDIEAEINSANGEQPLCSVDGSNR